MRHQEAWVELEARDAPPPEKSEQAAMKISEKAPKNIELIVVVVALLVVIATFVWTRL